MNKFLQEKALAYALIAATGLSFVATTAVEAEPLFPPAHHASNAVLSESQDVTRRITVGPWYRPQSSVPAAVLDTPVAGRDVYVARDSGPWYRAVN